MPRRSKEPQKTTINVVVNGKPVGVTLHPPIDHRKSWYAYWTGLTYAKSTGQKSFEDAATAVEDMVRGGGKRTSLADAILTDKEFEEIQRRHYHKKSDEKARERSRKSLNCCTDAIRAFRAITNLEPITLATPEDCERFQHEALKLPKNWRSKLDKTSDDTVKTLSPNTVVKWSRALQAAWERANMNAGKKCIRSVVPAEKLLTENPWHRFDWIEPREKPIRQFDGAELLSILEFFEQTWPNVSVAALAAKVFLWSWARRSEVAGLRWSELRMVENEHHFRIVGKANVVKWFRIPEALYSDLSDVRCNSDYVFAAFNEQLRLFFRQSKQAGRGKSVGNIFNPDRFGGWFYRQIAKWSESQPNGKAYVHVFRKTTLQYARRGEDINKQVAADARLGEGVMMAAYVTEADEELRQRSNRTYNRILAALPPKVAKHYGFEAPVRDPLKEQHDAAVRAENWELAARLAIELAGRKREAVDSCEIL